MSLSHAAPGDKAAALACSDEDAGTDQSPPSMHPIQATGEWGISLQCSPPPLNPLSVGRPSVASG